MSKWRKSNLKIGDELNIPEDLFVEKGKAKARLTSCQYIGETDTGILVDCYFIPPLNKKPEENHYRKFIDWASIYCGQVKVYRGDEMIRAYREYEE